MLFPFLLAFALAPQPAPPGPPDFTPILRIGRIDNSCTDLKTVPLDASIQRYAADKPIDPADWPAVQPGAIDAWAGSRPYTYRFQFNTLAAAEAGTYRIRIGFLGAHPYSPPAVRIQVGDKIWADAALKPGKQYIPQHNTIQDISPSVTELDIPASALPRGPVTVAISHTRASSWVFYDGIEVLYSREPLEPQLSDFSITPLPLIRADSGKQIARLHARARGVPAPLQLFQPRDQQVVAWSLRGAVTIGETGSTILNGDVDAEVLLDPAPESRTLATELVATGDGPPIGASAEFTQRPVRHFELFVVPEAHFDNGYTHPQQECLDRAVTNLRAALDLAARFDNFSWTSESAYIVQQWWGTAPEPERDRFLQLVRSGRLGFDAAYCNILSGLCTGEELHRLFSFAGSFAAAHQLDLKTATLTDVPSHTWSLPSALAAAGIEFLSIGGNQTRGGFWRLGEDLFWKPAMWEGPDGAQVFTLIHRHYAHATIVGLTESLAAAERGLPKWLEPYDTPDYPYTAVHLHGAYWDNALADARLPETVKAWNDKYRWPRVRLATNAEFLTRLRAEAQSAGSLPVIKGDGGAYWEDGAASSAAQTIINRKNARRLAVAEMLLTLQHAQGKLPDYPEGQLRQAWENVLLYDEHTWGAAWSITRPDDPGTKQQFDRKARYATDAEKQIDALFALAAKSDPALATPERTPATNGIKVEGATITSPFYRVTLDPKTGLIASIIDIATNRELVEPPSGTAPLFGQLVYETKPRRNPPDSNDLAPGSARSVPQFASITPIPGGLRSSFRHPMFSRVDLSVTFDPAFPSLPSIHLQYDLEKNPTTDCEGVYIAFPFRFAAPHIEYDNAGAIVRAGRDWLPHACLDWFTTESFVRLLDPATGFAAAWSSPDAPLFELQDINTHRALKSLPIQNGRIYSYLMNNYWETNYQASQSGPFRFRFTITSGEGLSISGCLDAVAADRPPAVATALDSIADADPPCRLTAFKRAEDQDGYILRLWNPTDFHGPATLKLGAFPGGLASASRTTTLEAPLPGAEPPMLASDGRHLTLHIHPHETITLRLHPRN